MATDYGAVGNGTTNDTAALAVAATAAAGATLVLPKGVYLIDSLVLPAGTTLRGEGSATLKARVAASPVVTLSANCTVNGVSIHGNSFVKTGIDTGGSADFNITGCSITNCGSAGIVVSGSGGVSVRGHISGNTIKSCDSGIQWWGGDSAVSSTVGLYDLTITGNSVETAAGGIWGSLGGRISITGNTVKNCTDVGVDVEGGTNCVITGNTVANCLNGGITLFYGAKRITITGNNVRQDSGCGPAIAFKTSTTSSQVTVSGNTLQAVAHMAIATDAHALSDSVIDGNLMEAGYPMAVRLLDCYKVNTTNNKISVNQSAPSGSGTIGLSYEGTSESLISGNQIELTVSDVSTANQGAGIYLYWRSAGYPCQKNTVTNNVVKGFLRSINDQCWGDASSWNAIQGNRVDAISRKNLTGWSGVISNNISYANPTLTVTPTSY